MSVVKNLEAMINLENNLKAQYQTEIDALKQEIVTLTKANEALGKDKEALQTAIDKQIITITELTAINTDTKRIEQTNRELNNRADKLQAELDMQKTRAKTIQKDLNEARQLVKTLQQYDAEKLKKNLVATKQTLAEQRDANALLNKTANKTKAENNELQATITELKAELEALKPSETEATDDVQAESTETVEAKSEVKKAKKTAKAA
jgi:predicted RNase H-like nuclease (RuvC/YqgF family)